ncbi:MAG: bifunctional DNA primase/polymerase [Acidimicrobiales bacterium]
MSEGATVLGPIGGPLVEHALAYAAAGLEVFPVNPRDKTPLESQHHATCDVDTLAVWWRQWPEALIGHRLAAGVVVTDVDPRHGGLETWKALRGAIGELPPTRVHQSGRGDLGMHLWWQHPGGRLNVKPLTEWAREREVGHAITLADGTVTNRWTSGIDLLHRDHRYTILPPSPHPETHRPYVWVDGRGLGAEPAPMPALLVELLTAPAPAPAASLPPATPDPDSIADRFSATTSWASLLGPQGWTLVQGDGESDGSAWRHPRATSAVSATIKHGCLFAYTPNTPFEVTEPGDPHGYTPFHAYAVLEHGGDQREAARAAREAIGGTMGPRIDVHALVGDQAPIVGPQPEAGPDVVPPLGPQPIDWSAFWQREHIGEDWLVHPILPRGRQVAIWARHKTGKSLLTLEVAAALATGQGCLSQAAAEPIDVIYLDMEMTEDDLRERLEDLGYGPEVDMSRLHYYLLPSMPPLDTAAGGAMLANLATLHGAQAVVIDTMARVVAGDENDADTYRSFYRHTGITLKAMGISVLRLDHGGKDASKGQRGSSGKGDDVDVVWQLRPADGGLELVRDVARMSWVPDKVALLRTSEPLRHMVTSGGLWPAGTKDAAAEMQRLGITPQDSQTKALATYREAGLHGDTNVLRAAHRYLKELARREVAEMVGEADEEAAF